MVSTPAQREVAMGMAITNADNGNGTITIGVVSPTTSIKDLIEDAQKMANFIADDTVPS